MRKALQMLAALLAAAVMLTAASAQEMANTHAEGLMEIAPITGEAKGPDSAHAQQASFVLRYQYPQFDAVTEADQAINLYYQAMAADLAQTPMLDGGEQAEITCEVAHNTARYISVVQTMTTLGGNGERETISADTFARDGVYAGQPLSLSQVLGLEEADELSTAYSVAETLAYELVWQIVAHDMQNADGDYPEGLTRENLEGVFLPETDFYLDTDGNIVFFIQAGELAGEVAGVLRFPFAAAELLSSIHQ